MFKRIVFIPIFLFQLCNICYAQLIPAGWFQQSSLITTKLNSVFFLDKLSGWIVGDGGVMLYSTNGGSNWQRQLNNTSSNLTKIFFSSTEIGYVIGTTGLIIKTTNGGINWYQQTSGTINDLTSASFVNDLSGYVSGLNNTLLKTSDGGLNWYSQNFLDTSNFYSIYFINNSTGWLSSVRDLPDGDSAYISKTTNAGVSWIIENSRQMDVGPNLSLQFTDSLNGWCAFQVPLLSASDILKTTNGGNTWVEYSGFISENYNLFFINNFIGWACGPQNRIYRSVNGGLNWIQSNSFPISVLYNSIFFIDSLNGWSVGDGGTILKTTTGGVLTNFTNTSSEIPNKYFLSQNYPNPFNPATHLEFGIPHQEFISLKVYDVLGNEAAVLVNEKKEPGSYEVQFDGSDLPSGIYFYRLEADGNLIDTKRMILLK